MKGYRNPIAELEEIYKEGLFFVKTIDENIEKRGELQNMVPCIAGFKSFKQAESYVVRKKYYELQVCKKDKDDEYWFRSGVRVMKPFDTSTTGCCVDGDVMSYEKDGTEYIIAAVSTFDYTQGPDFI